MRYPGFVGGAYQAQAKVIDGEESINLYPVPVRPDGGQSGKNDWYLNSGPGKAALFTLNDAPGRGLFAGHNRLFGASGSTLYEIFADNTAHSLGTIQAADTPAQAFQNGEQLFVVSGTQGYLDTGLALNPVIPAVMGGFIDGYFLAQQPDSNFVQFSAINDGTSWNPLDNFEKTGGADRLLATGVDHELVWLLGEFTTDLMQQTGDLNNPFQRIPGAVLPVGIGAPWSLAQIPDGLAPPGGLIFLAAYPHGTGVIVRTAGQGVQRISTHAIEAEIQTYPTVADAVAYIYAEWGHVFYSISFPSAYNGFGATWVCDLTTGFWHRRGAWDTGVGQWRADKARFHAYALGRHFVQDYRSGNLYQQQQGFVTDGPDPLRRLRSAPHLTNELNWTFYHSFQLDLQVGVPGLPSNPVGATASPVVVLQYSNDGGYTWSNEIQMGVGTMGDYRYRCMAFRLGRSRDRCFRIICTDPFPLYLVDAYLNVEAGL